METSQEASAVYTWELLGGISKAELTQGNEYDTIRLYTSDRTYYDAVSEDALSATDYFIQASQGAVSYTHLLFFFADSIIDPFKGC